MLGLYGGKDTGILADHVAAMKKALADAKAPSEIIVYPDAQHGFNADYRPSYKKDDAQDSWAKATRLAEEARRGLKPQYGKPT